MLLAVCKIEQRASCRVEPEALTETAASIHPVSSRRCVLAGAKERLGGGRIMFVPRSQRGRFEGDRGYAGDGQCRRDGQRPGERARHGSAEIKNVPFLPYPALSSR